MPEIPNRRGVEASYTARFAKLFADQKARMGHYLQRPGNKPPSGEWQRQEREVAALLLLMLDDVFQAGAAVIATDNAFAGLMPLGGATIPRASGDWSRTMADDLASRGVANTRTYLDDGGSLEVAYGRERAESLTVTEVTRARVAGETEVINDLNRRGAVITAYWRTEADARVCPICRPLNGADQYRWEQDFPDGPPAHPRCRCTLEYEIEGIEVA